MVEIGTNRKNNRKHGWFGFAAPSAHPVYPWEGAKGAFQLLTNLNGTLGNVMHLTDLYYIIPTYKFTLFLPREYDAPLDHAIHGIHCTPT